MNPKVSIVVLNWNGKEDTHRCLTSLQALTYSPYEVVIVDNGSEDDSYAHFRTHFPFYTLLEAKENLGYAGGNNLGIAYSLQQNADFILILNNDTVVDCQLLEHLTKEFQKNSQIGIVGACIYLMDDPLRFDHFGGKWNPHKLCFDYIGYRALDYRKPFSDLDYVCGAAMMVSAKVFQKIGLLDPRFFLYWEEADFCARAKKQQFALSVAMQAKIWHKVSASFQGNKAHAAYFIYRNRLLWIEQTFTGLRRYGYLVRIFLFDFTFLQGLKCIRLVQLGLQTLMGQDKTRNKERITRYNARLYGMYDYLCRRFGKGRSKNFMNCH